MRLIFFKLLLFLIPFFLFGQTSVIITVEDEAGKKVPYATIFVKKNNKEHLFYADNNGKLDLAVIEKMVGETDSLWAEAPGYEIFCAGIRQVREQKVIILKQKTIFVAPVIVSANKGKKPKLVRYGLRNAGGADLSTPVMADVWRLF